MCVKFGAGLLQIFDVGFRFLLEFLSLMTNVSLIEAVITDGDLTGHAESVPLGLRMIHAQAILVLLDSLLHVVPPNELLLR